MRKNLGAGTKLDAPGDKRPRVYNRDGLYAMSDEKPLKLDPLLPARPANRHQATIGAGGMSTPGLEALLADIKRDIGKWRDHVGIIEYYRKLHSEGVHHITQYPRMSRCAPHNHGQGRIHRKSPYEASRGESMRRSTLGQLMANAGSSQRTPRAASCM